MGDTSRSDRKTPRQVGRAASVERRVFLVLPFVGAILYGGWSLHRADSYYGDLERLGVETQATIISKQIVRSNTKPARTAYDMTVGFTVGDKMRRGHVRVTRRFYHDHAPPDRVPIRYLPDDPQVRWVDPAMQGHSMRGTLTIVGILLFIGVANLFIEGNKTGGVRRRTGEQGQ